MANESWPIQPLFSYEQLIKSFSVVETLQNIWRLINQMVRWCFRTSIHTCLLTFVRFRLSDFFWAALEKEDIDTCFGPCRSCKTKAQNRTRTLNFRSWSTTDRGYHIAASTNFYFYSVQWHTRYRRRKCTISSILDQAPIHLLQFFFAINIQILINRISSVRKMMTWLHPKQQIMVVNQWIAKSATLRCMSF